MININIYKRTSTGAIQQWKQETNPENSSQYRTISGQVNGKLVTSEWKQAKAKNEGKANATTPEEQALLEIESNYKNKLSRDYHKDINKIDKPKIFKPMLARGYTDTKLNFPVFSQPKLDGIRCIATKDGLFSRNGKPILSCPHIHKELLPLFEEDFDLIFDGELYNHDYKDDFNKIISLTRKTKPTEEDIAEAAKHIQYHIYDFPSKSELTFGKRFIALNYALMNTDTNILRVVETRTCRVDKDLDLCYTNYLNDGYEGQMIRDPKSKYEQKRSKGLVKRKEDKSEEFILIDILEGQGNYAGVAKIAILEDIKGKQFSAGIAGTQEFNKKLLKEKDQYRKTLTTVVFFDYTPDGVPRFGRVKEWNRSDI